MKVGISLPDDLVTFADEEARSRGTTRSGLLAELLKAERQQKQLRTYLDRHGWDIVEDEESWREYQRGRTAEEYGADDW
ncbi:MAG: hypothetical protein AAF481_12275 [Acidobacteriota bacterium]